MISERQINFRNEYRSRVATWYNGYGHILIIYFIGFSTIYICSKHIAPVL